MPAAIPILTLIVSGLSAGVSAYQSHDASINQNAAQDAQKKALQQQQQTQANQANLTKQEAVLGQQGQAQQQTGGSLTDSGTASLVDLLAGYPGFQGGSSTSTVTGGASTPAIAPTTLGTGGAGSPDVASILATLKNGGNNFGSGGSSISGGNWQVPPAQSQTKFELSSPVLG